MFSNKMITKKKILILLVILAALVIGVVVFQSNFSLAATAKTKPIKAVGMAKFVLKGTVISVSRTAVSSANANTLTLRITNTSKNAKIFDGKDKNLSIGTKTTITKNGKNIALTQIKPGNKVKVFGIFDKKTGAIILVRWVKVVSK